MLEVKQMSIFDLLEIKNQKRDLTYYWNDLPIGREKAISYTSLKIKWGISERMIRRILHELSRIDTGDNYVLIRSSHNKGFYKSCNIAEIERYKREVISRAQNTYAPLKKINRVLKEINNE